MVNPARRKGTGAETDVVEWLKRQGYPGVERHALHGNRDIGDINGLPGLVVSVKWVGKDQPMRLSTWTNELYQMRENVQRRSQMLGLPEGVLIVRRPMFPSPGNWYAVQMLQDWWKLYEEASK